MQVYAVMYAGSGAFLLGLKLERGYFFHNSQGGVVLPRGQALKAGGKYALPGGKKNFGESLTDAAHREFTEETAVQLPRDDVATKEFGHQYAAAYFKVTDRFADIAGAVINDHLPEGLSAMQAVIDGKAQSYAQLREQFPAAPPDNELEKAYVWNVRSAEDWKKIEGFQNDPDIDWYYHVLAYLKESLLALATVP